MRVAKRYIVSGRVQGVGFRYFTASAAARHGVNGWARNLPDGRVEISVEAEADALDRFERQIRQGPPGARVDDIEVDNRTAAGQASGFTIK